MSPRFVLPPPPPPVEIRAWPDRDALLADRSFLLGVLVKAHIGPGRLGLLWLWGVVGAIGWSFIGTAVITFEESYDAISAIMGVVMAALGAAALIPAVILAVVGLRRDVAVRRLLTRWGELDRDPARDAALRLPGTTLGWLLPSFALGALGLCLCVVVPAGAVRGEDTYGLMALIMGLGLLAWLIGLIGVFKAFWHRRWIVRTLAGAAAPPPLVSRGPHG
ncbi:hypothetical protein FKN01_17080 [Streptomyces sp. 130]|uniref:hypothetical protein n=1 Tax=Streptomyces sp. 130 TaxID=2591006 RepID=UPI00117F0C10|nr:hypothetical protein [Streptomyces sp. 130]TRV77077.1 hypothetical protein FKN01_17080 [Streptomyces sp. 130]